MHATLCDYIAEIAQNAIEAGATQIGLEIQSTFEDISVAVTDNGKGMDAAQMARARDPFYSEAGKHDARRVGLGIPLLCQAVEATGGDFELQSRPGHGTRVCFRFSRKHLDTPPMGSLATTLLMLMMFDGDYELKVTRRTPAGEYTVSRRELSGILGRLEESENAILARQYLRSQEDAIETASNGG